MKTDIHPNYQETTVVCSCGNTFVTRSTVESLHVELCNECHPFFTGKQKLVDSGGRVERFQKRYGRTTFTGRGGEPAKADRPAKPAKSSKSAEAPSEQPEAETASEIEAAPEAVDT